VDTKTIKEENFVYALAILQSPGINTKLKLIYFEIQVSKADSALREVHST
jgi:hypothetical protein